MTWDMAHSTLFGIGSLLYLWVGLCGFPNLAGQGFCEDGAYYLAWDIAAVTFCVDSLLYFVSWSRPKEVVFQHRS